jgi:hypothetical protein
MVNQATLAQLYAQIGYQSEGGPGSTIEQPVLLDVNDHAAT